MFRIVYVLLKVICKAIYFLKWHRHLLIYFCSFLFKVEVLKLTD